MHLQIEEALATPNRIIANRTTSRHITFKLMKIKVNRENLKVAGKKKYIMQISICQTTNISHDSKDKRMENISKMLKENINTKLQSENEDKDIFNNMRCENIHHHQTCLTEMLKEGFSG